MEGARPWRVGRKVGRTIYVQRGDTPSDADILIGILDTPELAESAVGAYNHWLAFQGRRQVTRD